MKNKLCPYCIVVIKDDEQTIIDRFHTHQEAIKYGTDNAYKHPRSEGLLCCMRLSKDEKQFTLYEIYN